jgi:1-acyl-sn-glycerol-3-phosphate acyltransferase
MSEIETGDRCTATTKTGSRCKNKVQVGTRFCYRHQVKSVSAAPDTESNRSEAEVSTPSYEEMRQQLINELNELVARVRIVDPDYVPPPRTDTEGRAETDIPEDEPQRKSGSGLFSTLRKIINQDLLDSETWRGFWYMANYTLEYQSDIAKRRLTGDYETDEWGLDWEFLEVIRPFLDFMYKVYWRIETKGIENIPDYDRAILVSNQSGQVPWDSLMIMTAILDEHPAQRLVRNLYADWFPTLPFLSSALVKIGQTLATEENGVRLLEQDELVCVYPEGYKGFGKLFKDRYKLSRFGWQQFVQIALKTQSPIIPVSVTGAEETYLTMARVPGTKQMTGFPNLPITLRFPWFGLLGTVPLPTKWFIDIGEAIDTEGYGPEAAEDLILVSKIADQTRNVIQEMLNTRLSERRSVFY